MRTYQHTAFLHFIDMMHFTTDTKTTPASVQGVGVDF
jgi:hypothetical protein